MANIDWNLKEQNKGLRLVIILCVCILTFTYILIAKVKAEVNSKLIKCSRYTVGKVIRTKRWRYKTLLIYSFVLNGKVIEGEDRPNPSNLNEWWTTDYENMLGRRLWIQSYCDDPNVHKTLWDIKVPKTIEFIPENGWNALPTFVK